MAPTAPPAALVAVDDDTAALGRIAEELRRRYGADYDVLCASSPQDALATLERMRDAGEQVAVVLAAQWMEEMRGPELLARVRELHPLARRALLIPWGGWGDRPTADAVMRAMALGQIDYYVLKPWFSPDEYFHRTICEYLHEWSRAAAIRPQEVAVVAEPRSPRTHEIRSLLARNGVPHRFHTPDSDEARRLLESAGIEFAGAPMVTMLDGRVLVDPTATELAGAYGVSTEVEDAREFDVVVVGAGPGGLAAAVYAASEGLSTLVIERESIGGQAGSSSLIRNYLGFSRGVSGAELAQRAYQQAWIFGTRFVLMRTATQIRTGADGRHTMEIAGGGEVTARAVVLATGVSYRRLGVPGLEKLAGSGVYYGASVAEASGLAGEEVYVVGGGNSAGQAAMHLARFARRVTMLVRGPSLEATMSRYLLDEIDAAANVEVLPQTEVVGAAGEGHLERLTLRSRAGGGKREVAAAAVFVLIGARPHTAWLPAEIERDERGYVQTGPLVHPDRWPLARPPQPYETSVPGVFAVGDVRNSSVKRVASAVGEGSVVIQQVHQHLAAAPPPRPATARG